MRRIGFFSCSSGRTGVVVAEASVGCEGVVASGGWVTTGADAAVPSTRLTAAGVFAAAGVVVGVVFSSGPVGVVGVAPGLAAAAPPLGAGVGVGPALGVVGCAAGLVGTSVVTVGVVVGVAPGS